MGAAMLVGARPAFFGLLPIVIVPLMRAVGASSRCSNGAVSHKVACDAADNGALDAAAWARIGLACEAECSQAEHRANNQYVSHIKAPFDSLTSFALVGSFR